MYQFPYAEVLGESSSLARETERRALEHSIALLQAAEKHGMQSQQMVEALHFTRALWTILINDLADKGNELPEQLRASLISIGIGVLREADDVRLGRSPNVNGLVEITKAIAEGLR